MSDAVVDCRRPDVIEDLSPLLPCEGIVRARSRTNMEDLSAVTRPDSAGAGNVTTETTEFTAIWSLRRSQHPGEHSEPM